MNVTGIIAENKKRLTSWRKQEEYNPYSGEGSTSLDRVLFEVPDAPLKKMWLPKGFINDPLIRSIKKHGSLSDCLYNDFDTEPTEDAIATLWDSICERRFNHDFEFWAAMTITITPKDGGEDIPFILNPGQRKLLKALEKMRIAGKPIRVILVKARQWGGSTLIQIYLAWIQIIHKKNWNSAICAHLETASRIIRGMYQKAIDSYPQNYSKTPLKLTPYQKSVKTSIIKNTKCRITIGSAEKPDGVRSENLSMAHLSEVGLWKATEGKKPEDIVQAVTSGILYKPYTVIVYESTAKGVGNFFHKQWIRAVSGKSAYTPVFIAWYEIEQYSLPIKDYVSFIEAMSEYELYLWAHTPATLEQIHWYRVESLDKEEWRMKSEFPSFADEAFQSTGNPVFNRKDVLRLAENCISPAMVGDIVSNGVNGKEALINIRFVDNSRGSMKIWELPNKHKNITRQYLVSVDIGGRSSKSDPSSISVFNREYMMEPGGVPEIVADWHGHIDHDLLAWLAAKIAVFYNDALLVFETNTYETNETEGSHGEYILDEIVEYYKNLYARTSSQNIRSNVAAKWGWHTNVQTKTLIIDNGIKLMRTDGYIERDQDTISEYLLFENKQDGSTGAVDGNHDDKVMSRLIGLYVCYDFKYYALPSLVQKTTTTTITKPITSKANF